MSCGKFICLVHLSQKVLIDILIIFTVKLSIAIVNAVGILYIYMYINVWWSCSVEDNSLVPDVLMSKQCENVNVNPSHFSSYLSC